MTEQLVFIIQSTLDGNSEDLGIPRIDNLVLFIGKWWDTTLVYS
jgi:hypothetical protein